MKILQMIALLLIILIAGCTLTVSNPTEDKAMEATEAVPATELTDNLGEDVSSLESLDEELNVEDVDVQVDELESIDF